MEMLAQMEGTEDALRSLNHAEIKPEDSMHTDEWMYELKNKKEWATGEHVPEGKQPKPAGTKTPSTDASK
ncbi:hypothetical protein DIPPA_29278 [Diplonema papillatum]|nr:hypothetical protein DIPPA_29278 [Diplonema papillatum]